MAKVFKHHFPTALPAHDPDICHPLVLLPVTLKLKENCYISSTFPVTFTLVLASICLWKLFFLEGHQAEQAWSIPPAPPTVPHSDSTFNLSTAFTLADNPSSQLSPSGSCDPIYPSFSAELRVQTTEAGCIQSSLPWLLCVSVSPFEKGVITPPA